MFANNELYTLLTTGFVDMVYAMHEVKAGGFPQAYCGQMAEQIQKQCGGELVAGWLDF